jgi:glycosyltransferase involved in cell wall biosynthesis
MSLRSRILVLTPDQPYPVRAGGQMRMVSILPMLASIGNVHIACALPGVEEATRQWAQAKGMTIEPAATGSSSLWRQNLERLKAVVTLSNLRFRRSECIRFERICRQFSPDLVWLETPYLLRYALRWARRIPVIVDYWGTSEGGRRLLLHSRGKERLSAWLRWRCAQGGEKRYAPRLQAIVCVSEDDAAFFRSMAPALPVRVVPNAIQFGESEGVIPPLHADSLRMIFTGDMSYRPNIDAAVHFTREIFPLIRTAVPDAHIVFSGRDPHPEVSSLATMAGVEVTGAVSSLSAEIARSAVYVLPMRLGSGIRTKLFEVFPLGVPVVTTSIGAEGLVLEHDCNCLVADSATEFADACIRLLGSVTERNRLGQAMREDAMAAYSHEAVSRIVRSVVEEILDGTASFRREPHRALTSTNPSKAMSSPIH